MCDIATRFNLNVCEGG